MLSSDPMRNGFVTGAAGFIGSNLVERLLAHGVAVVGWDNFSTGRRQFVQAALQHPNFTLHHGDNLDLNALTAAMRGCDFVFHLAANADVRLGLQHPERDLQQNTQATFNVLEAMRANGIRHIAFSSTGSVYGETATIPTPETCPMPVQTSLYGASKLACEALIQAYCEGFNFVGYIFRFVSILGERYTHGHVFDFLKQLRADPARLQVLGNGTQRKSYLYVQDCLDAVWYVIDQQVAEAAKHRVTVCNLGTQEYCTVKESVGYICEALRLSPAIAYGSGDRGWVGDNPFIFLDTAKVGALGWRPTLSIRASIERTVTWLNDNPWVFDNTP